MPLTQTVQEQNVTDGELCSVLKDLIRDEHDAGFKALHKQAFRRLGGDVNFCRVQRLVRALRAGNVENEAPPASTGTFLQSVLGLGLLNTFMPDAKNEASRAERDCLVAPDHCLNTVEEGNVHEPHLTDQADMEGNVHEPHLTDQADIEGLIPQELFGDCPVDTVQEGVEIQAQLADYVGDGDDMAAKIAKAQESAVERIRQAAQAAPGWKEPPPPRTPSKDLAGVVDVVAFAAEALAAARTRNTPGTPAKVDIAAQAAEALEAAKIRMASKKTPSQPCTPAKGVGRQGDTDAVFHVAGEAPRTPAKADIAAQAAAALEAAKARIALKKVSSQPCTPAKGVDIDAHPQVSGEGEGPRTPAKPEIAAQAAEALEAAKARSASKTDLAKPCTPWKGLEPGVDVEALAASALEAARNRKAPTPAGKLQPLVAAVCASPRSVPDLSEIAAKAASALQAARARSANFTCMQEQSPQPFQDEFWPSSPHCMPEELVEEPFTAETATRHLIFNVGDGEQHDESRFANNDGEKNQPLPFVDEIGRAPSPCRHRRSFGDM